eukprot:g9004.t1
MQSPTLGKVRQQRTVARQASPGTSPQLQKTLSPQNSMNPAFLTGLDLDSEEIVRSTDPTRAWTAKHRWRSIVREAPRVD